MMIGYFNELSEFCKDPVTGERGYFEYTVYSFFLLMTPILAPLYYAGKAISWLRAKEEEGGST